MQYLKIHADNPQQRLIDKVVETLNGNGVIAYPTDSSYALGCHIGNKSAMDRIRRIRELDDKHDFTLMCRDLSEAGVYARLNNEAFRLIKTLTPGPYTFILDATREVPKRLLNPKRKTIGIRIPDNPVALRLLECLGEPIMSVTLMLPGDDYPLTEMDEMQDRLKHLVDIVVDGGHCELEPTTVVNLVDDYPVLLRQGKGQADFLT